MAVGKEIRTKIKSVKNTQKITSAMEMVAASKMRKAQERMAASRPYSEKIRNVIGHLAHAHPEYRHSYMQERETKRIGVIIVSTDRGLCGGLNANLFRTLLREMREWNGKGVEIDLCTIGSKGNGFFRRFKNKILSSTSHLGDEPRIQDLIGSVKVMLDAFDEGEIDRLYVAYNQFENTMSQKPCVDQLLPIEKDDDQELEGHWDYLYEPEAKEVLTDLLTRYMESLVYQASVENAACEQAARMVAMKAATDNAGGMIDDLELVYNKARQAAITQELSEIVSGAAAV